MRPSRNEYVGVLAAIASSALGGVAGGTTRFAIGMSDPVTLGVFRFGVGFLLLLPLALALGAGVAFGTGVGRTTVSTSGSGSGA